MKTYRLTAPAKINLALDVVGRREDGYHELRTIMHTLPLADELTVEHAGDRFLFTTNRRYIVPETDISLKAARAFYAETGIEPGGLRVHTTKRIPVGAGLGGGSSDGAALLLHLNRYHGEPLDVERLRLLAASVGADLPFFVMAGLSGRAQYAALCEGIGEEISPLDCLPHCHILLAKPRASLSTAAMFRFLDSERAGEHPDVDRLADALRRSDLRQAARCCFNSMERAAAVKCRDIPQICGMMRTHGAIGACMSGSGSAVFGVFEGRRAAGRCASAIMSALPRTQIFRTEILPAE